MMFLASTQAAYSGGTSEEAQSAEEPIVSWSQSGPVKPADPERLDAEISFTNTKPIYGGESRVDWGAVEGTEFEENGKASVALFFEALTATTQQLFKSTSSTLEESQSLCPDERFANQLATASCSGTLIAPDIVLTAGHCVQEYRKDCEHDPVPYAKDIYFVFGYHASSKHDRGRDTFVKRQIYRGKRALGGACKSTGGDDWAMVQLDRPVPSTLATPVGKIRKTKIPANTEVYVIGYPSGLPLKKAGTAKVSKNSARAFFVADLDTFGGNSGSGVFDAASHELVGVLVRGATDYYEDPQGCRRAYRCKKIVKRPDSGDIVDCSGEDVTRVEIVPIP